MKKSFLKFFSIVLLVHFTCPLGFTWNPKQEFCTCVFYLQFFPLGRNYSKSTLLKIHSLLLWKRANGLFDETRVCWIGFFSQRLSVSRRCGTSRCLIFRCDAASQPSSAAQWPISFSHLFILYLKCFFFLLGGGDLFWFLPVEIHHQRNDAWTYKRRGIIASKGLKGLRLSGPHRGKMHLVWFPALFVNEEICLIADTKVLGNVFYVFDNRCQENTYYEILVVFQEHTFASRQWFCSCPQINRWCLFCWLLAAM